MEEKKNFEIIRGSWGGQMSMQALFKLFSTKTAVFEIYYVNIHLILMMLLIICVKSPTMKEVIFFFMKQLLHLTKFNVKQKRI